MNFLAHIYLSGNNKEITLGNFIGDFVKGNTINDFDTDIKKGIQLHRAIDHFTDTHPIVRESKLRLRPDFRHYSPVIVDVFYDHFLAIDWNEYSDIPLLKFTKDFYQMIDSLKASLPPEANHMLLYMKKDNWLYNYRLVEGIHRALSGMSRRTSFKSKMEYASENLKQHYEDYKVEFQRFFPALQKHCVDFLRDDT
ncbi:MAG: DUF479 domain-containing protein [Cytophagales bacterium]|nr:DUF479 domain-containing protein [Cytophagales bacterium]